MSVRGNPREPNTVLPPAILPRTEKDAVLKPFFENDDVFADVANFVLFHGKQVIRKKNLKTIHPVSLIHTETKVSWLERDILKLWNTNTMICMIGIENQSDIDSTILYRTMAYDGANYLDQIRKENRVFCPVFTIVLYFGKTPWNRPKTLYETLRVPDELKPFVNDWKMTVIDVLRISDEETRLFRSDFRVMVESLKNKYNPDYKGSRKQVKHKGELIDLMNAFGITAFTDEEKAELTEGPLTERKILSAKERKTIFKSGKAEGKAEGRAEGKTEDLQIIMETLKLPFADAAQLLRIPEAEQEAIRKRIALNA